MAPDRRWAPYTTKNPPRHGPLAVHPEHPQGREAAQRLLDPNVTRTEATLEAHEHAKVHEAGLKIYTGGLLIDVMNVDPAIAFNTLTINCLAPTANRFLVVLAFDNVGAERNGVTRQVKLSDLLVAQRRGHLILAPESYAGTLNSYTFGTVQFTFATRDHMTPFSVLLIPLDTFAADVEVSVSVIQSLIL